MEINKENALTFIEKVNSYSIDEAIDYAKKLDDLRIWKIVLSRSDIHPFRLIKESFVSNDTELGLFIFSLTKVKKYLNNMYVPCVINLACYFRHHFLWSAILKRMDVKNYLNKLPPFYAIEFAKQKDSHEIWWAILRRCDISIPDVVNYNKKFYKYPRIKEIIEKRPDFENFFKTYPIPEVIDLIEKEMPNHDNSYEWKIILSRPDIRPSEIIRCATITGSSDIQKLVFSHKIFINYFKNLSFSEAIRFFEKVDCFKILMLILCRLDYNITEVINFAKEYKEKDGRVLSIIWKCICSRDDYSLNKKKKNAPILKNI